MKKLPAGVGQWTKSSGGSADSTQYKDSKSNLVGVSFQDGVSLEGMASNVTLSKTKAGTGVCGTTEVVSNVVCYLKAADGVFTLVSDANQIPLPKLVTFANQLTKALGTS